MHVGRNAIKLHSTIFIDSEWTPVDQDQEVGQETQAPEEEPRPVVQQSVLDHSSRTLLDVTPVHTPAPSVGDNPTPIVLPVATPIRVSTPECACSRLASLRGVTRIYVEDQTHFKVGKIIIISELFMAQVIARVMQNLDLSQRRSRFVLSVSLKIEHSFECGAVHQVSSG